MEQQQDQMFIISLKTPFQFGILLQDSPLGMMPAAICLEHLKPQMDRFIEDRNTILTNSQRWADPYKHGSFDLLEEMEINIHKAPTIEAIMEIAKAGTSEQAPIASMYLRGVPIAEMHAMQLPEEEFLAICEVFCSVKDYMNTGIIPQL